MKMHLCIWLWLSLAVVAMSAGCRPDVYFPLEPMRVSPAGFDAGACYDVDGDGRADFFTFTGADGMISDIGYDTTADGRCDVHIPTAAVPLAGCRHLVIILDGFGYDVVKDYYDAGHLRMFHPPSRMVAPYPSVTELALSDVLGCGACRGFEAMYFDHKTNRLAGGSMSYMLGGNERYNHLLQYRANMIWDPVSYLFPWWFYKREINGVKRCFDDAPEKEVIAYLVSSAGVSTAQGAGGQRKCLQRVEQLVNQVIWETRGLTKVTLLADHGHSYTHSTQIPLKDYLRKRRWHLTDSLRGPRDVVFIRFGLVTYAGFTTRKPAMLAEDLIAFDGVELASYAKGDTVVVLGGGGSRAVISQKAGRYKYEPTAGDPLELKAVLASLSADADGYVGGDSLLKATIDHKYPDSLGRLWRAHLALVPNPPDVIISLEDRFFSGSGWMGAIEDVASTHGSLNRRNSVTFIMSTIGPLPKVMRSADVGRNIRALTSRQFPLRK